MGLNLLGGGRGGGALQGFDGVVVVFADLVLGLADDFEVAEELERGGEEVVVLVAGEADVLVLPAVVELLGDELAADFAANDG